MHVIHPSLANAAAIACSGASAGPRALVSALPDAVIAATRLDEIGCDEYYEQLDRFAELVLAGQDAAAALPLVQDHLDRCRDCREEFEALLAALQTTTFPRRPTSYPA